MSENSKPTKKKRYVERPDVRKKLLDAAEALVVDEGYASATVRRIAEKAGVKHQAVFYYFGSQDELLLSLYQRASDLHEEHLRVALGSEDPIRGLWKVVSDAESTALGLEFMALANHNEKIRKAIAKRAKAFRKMEIEAITRYLEERGIEARLSPQLVSILTTAIGRVLVQEKALGIRTGHKEVMAMIEKSLGDFEATGEANSEVEPIVVAMSPAT